MAGEISLAINPSSSQRVAAMLGGTSSYLKAFVRDTLYQEAALTARAFMKFSPPMPKGGGFGDTHQAKKQGEKAIDRDIRSFVKQSANGIQQLGAIRNLGEAVGFESFLDWRYTPASRIKHSILKKIHADEDINRAWEKFKNITARASKPSGEMGKPLKTGAELAQVHRSLKEKYRGRITRNNGPGSTLKKYPYILKENKIVHYIKQVQANVGTLNHYWWQVIQRIPMIRIRGIDALSAQKGVPNWVKRSPYVNRAQGRIVDNAKNPVGGNASITIINPIGDIFGVAREAQTTQKVMQYRRAAMAKRPWQSVLDRAVQVANKGGKPQ